MERLKINVKERTLICELQYFVIAHNKILKNEVFKMTPVILLRNVHPLYRGEFAYSLYKKNVISKEEAREFVKMLLL